MRSSRRWKLVLLTVVEQRGLLQVVLVLVVFAWPVLTSVMRTEVRRVSRREYVTAARSLGASQWAILRRHVVPNATGALGSVAVLLTATMITTEAILTFVGAGLRMPNVSWGILLAEARERLASASHLALPGVFLVVAAGALIMLADALREHRRPDQGDRPCVAERGSDEPFGICSNDRLYSSHAIR